MKKTVISISVCFLLSGCAAVQQTGDDMAKEMGVSKAGGGATVGAAAGCVGGAVLGYLAGVGAGTGCIAGAVVGGAVGYTDGRQRDLDDAKKLVEDIKSTNLSDKQASSSDSTQYTPEIQTREIEVTQKDKPVEKVSAFKSLTVPIPQGSIHDRSPAVEKTLSKIGGFAASRSTDTVIVVAVAKKDRKFIEKELDEGIASAHTNREKGTKVGTQQTPITHIKFVYLEKNAIPKITVVPVDVTV